MSFLSFKLHTFHIEGFTTPPKFKFLISITLVHCSTKSQQTLYQHFGASNLTYGHHVVKHWRHIRIHEGTLHLLLHEMTAFQQYFYPQCMFKEVKNNLSKKNVAKRMFS
jgi:hypothetical protein